MVVILLLTALPLWNLTHQTESALPPADIIIPAKIKTRIDLTFVQVPVEFQLLQFGKVIWKSESPVATIGKEFEIEFPKEGIDLEIKAAWPVGTEVSAVRVTVTPGDQEPIEKSAWGQASLDEVLTFHESN